MPLYVLKRHLENLFIITYLPLSRVPLAHLLELFSLCLLLECAATLSFRPRTTGLRIFFKLVTPSITLLFLVHDWAIAIKTILLHLELVQSVIVTLSKAWLWFDWLRLFVVLSLRPNRWVLHIDVVKDIEKVPIMLLVLLGDWLTSVQRLLLFWLAFVRTPVAFAFFFDLWQHHSWFWQALLVVTCVFWGVLDLLWSVQELTFTLAHWLVRCRHWWLWRETLLVIALFLGHDHVRSKLFSLAVLILWFFLFSRCCFFLLTIWLILSHWFTLSIILDFMAVLLLLFFWFLVDRLFS